MGKKSINDNADTFQTPYIVTPILLFYLVIDSSIMLFAIQKTDFRKNTIEKCRKWCGNILRLDKITIIFGVLVLLPALVYFSIPVVVWCVGGIDLYNDWGENKSIFTIPIIVTIILTFSLMVFSYFWHTKHVKTHLSELQAM